MLSLFKKKKKPQEVVKSNFEVELIAAVLAYEIARSDGEITDQESELLVSEIKKISQKVQKNELTYDYL